MRITATGDLKPGMMLAAPVLDFQGVLLLKAGTELTENNIRMLKSWGVPEVKIEGRSGDDEGPDPESQSGIKESIMEELAEKFSDVTDDPVMMEIMHVAGKMLNER